MTPAGEKRSRVDRFLLSIMGPAQRGENKVREGYVPDPDAELCRKCGQPWAVHTRRHKDNITYLECPTRG